MPYIEVKIALQSDPVEVRDLRPRLTALGLESGLENAADSFASAVAEALNNCVEHAYGMVLGQSIELNWRGNSEAVTVEIRDWGKPMERIPLGTCPDPLGFPDGGFGWFIIRQWTDGVTYSASPHGNLLTLVKCLPGPTSRPPAAGPRPGP